MEILVFKLALKTNESFILSFVPLLPTLSLQSLSPTLSDNT
jgi:hypothetical protein